MRILSMVAISLLSACPGKGGGPPAPAPDNEKIEEVQGGVGFWRFLAQPDARWVLRDDVGENKELVIEAVDVTKVGDADVVTLAITVDGAPETPRVLAGVRWAVTDQGLWMIRGDDEASIMDALAGPPSWPNPPLDFDRESNQGLFYGELRDGRVCIGQGDPPEDGVPCEGLCEGELCATEEHGIVYLGGRWTPEENFMYSRAE